MELKLKDKVFLVTGGAKGIGLAIARSLCDEGALPVIVDRDAEAASQLSSEPGIRHRFIQAELASAENCAKAVERAVRESGQLDGLVNNAGVNDRVGLESGTPQAFVASLERNLFHYYNMAHYTLPHLKKTHGCILNISSKTALTGQGGTSGYVAAKGAILAMTREWAAELLPFEIRVNAIVPAEVMTPLYQQWLGSFPEPQVKLEGIISKIPLGKRMTKPEEIAALATFLLSERAAHITGQHLFVDGGYVHLDRALT